MPRKLPYVAMSPAGDIVIIPASKKFASIILADDYDKWRDDPGNFASYAIESKIQTDMLVAAITADAQFVLERIADGILMTFRFHNGLILAVPITADGAVVQISPAPDFVALPHGVMQYAISIEIVRETARIEFEHGDN